MPITISFPSGEASPFLSVLPNHQRRNEYWVHVFGRLRPGIVREQAAAALNPLYRAILNEVEAPLLTNVDERELDAFRTRSLVLEPGGAGQTANAILDSARNSLKLMLAVSGGVLLLCCANVAGLILLRTATRSGEMAVRASIGATRSRLASLLLTESLVLALPATVLSLPVASVTLRAVSRVPGIPEAAFDVGLSAAAAFAAIGVALASALIVGLLPVRGLTRVEPGRTLQSSGTRQTSAKGVARFRAAVAAAQVALSMALLALTFVFAQSLANIARVDLGADIDSVVMVSVLPPPAQLTTDGAARRRLEEALAAIPGVSSIGTSEAPLLSPDGWGSAIEATVAGVHEEALPVFYNYVTPDFFRTFGVRLLAGREFDETDAQRPVTIVNQRLVERFGLTPELIIGRSISFGLFTAEVAGVVSDVRFGDVTGEIEPQIFLPPSDGIVWVGPATFYVRSARPPHDLFNDIREAVARVDPTRPITDLHTVEQQFGENIATERFVAGTSTAFAVLATALAALGLYGVLAYSVAQRSREIGLRFALGAPANRVRAMVLRQVAGMAVIGIVLGAIAASVLGRAASGLLFGVEANDPLAFSAAAAVLAAVVLGATHLPARHASRVDPMKVLRYE